MAQTKYLLGRARARRSVCQLTRVFTNRPSERRQLSSVCQERGLCITPSAGLGVVQYSIPVPDDDPIFSTSFIKHILQTEK